MYKKFVVFVLFWGLLAVHLTQCFVWNSLENNYVSSKPNTVSHELVIAVITTNEDAPSLNMIKKTWLKLLSDIRVVIFDDNALPSQAYHNLDFAQYKWKYLISTLWHMYPNSKYYLVVDDDVFLFPANLRKYLGTLVENPFTNSIIYAADSFSSGLEQLQCLKISSALNFTQEEFFQCQNWSLIAGGSMLFTNKALKVLSDPWVLHTCVDDLLILRASNAYPFEGGYEMSFYNQDHLFSWCLQARLDGKIIHNDDIFAFYGGSKRLYFELNILVKRLDTDWFHCEVQNWIDHKLAIVHKLNPSTMLDIWEQCKFIYLVDPEAIVTPIPTPKNLGLSQSKLMLTQLKLLEKHISDNPNDSLEILIQKLNLRFENLFKTRYLWYYLLLEKETAMKIIDSVPGKELQENDFEFMVKEFWKINPAAKNLYPWYQTLVEKLENYKNKVEHRLLSN